MSRDYAAIMKSTETAQAATVQNEVISLPPGYIVGFDVRLRQDYTVLIKAGAANVGGSLVQISTDHQLEEADWVAPKINSTRHYYIYIAKDGSFKVDIIAPVWNNDLLYYEQPDMNWRAIGKIFLADKKIIFGIKEVEKTEQMVTVAPSGFTGKADYYCTGTNDEILINAAILYVSSAYFGGTIQLLGGTFNTVSAITIANSKIVLTGMGKPTLAKSGNNSTITINGRGPPYYSGVQISNISFTQTDTSNNYLISSIWTIGLLITNCNITSPYYGGISVTNCTHPIVTQNIFSGLPTAAAPGYLVYCVSGSMEFTNNLIDGLTTSSACTQILRIAGSHHIISKNKFENIKSSAGTYGIYFAGTYCNVEGNNFNTWTTSGAGLSIYPIYISSDYVQIVGNTINTITATTASSGKGVVLDGCSYCTISNNHISVCSGGGIYITSGTSNSCGSNYCYNNGSDTGIANTNQNNFYDTGTDTQVYSNSWQMPVAGEPSLGTSHPRGSDPTAWDINGISSTSYSMASPYTWDLSGVLPVGARAVDITLYIYANTTANISAGELICWQYELGTSPSGPASMGPKGVVARVGKMVASDFTYDYVFAQNDGKILLGPSRKLYVGFTNNTGHTGYAMWKFYDC